MPFLAPQATHQFKSHNGGIMQIVGKEMAIHLVLLPAACWAISKAGAFPGARRTQASRVADADAVAAVGGSGGGGGENPTI